jgi:hypothetical protein
MSAEAISVVTIWAKPTRNPYFGYRYPDCIHSMNLFKSKQRVADHGEVFTPPLMVEAMLDLVKENRAH